MNTHNVKTAASESTETRVKQNFDVLLPVRADRLLTLAQLEGNLMMYRALAALDAFGPDHLDDLLSDVRYAAQRITTMLDEGDTAAPDRAEPVDTGQVLRDISSPVNEPIVKPETERGRSRLQARWQRQMDELGFDIKQVISDARAREELQSAPEAPLRPDATEAGEAVMQQAIKKAAGN